MRETGFVLALGCGLIGFSAVAGAVDAPAAASAPEEFSPEVKAVLDQRTGMLVQQLAVDPLIQQAVRDSNERNTSVSQAEILRLDAEWQSTKGLNDFIKSFLASPCAERLIAFQDNHDGFSEIFIADARGLVVAETNKTSDYYQADEDWWVRAYDEGRGKTFHGDIEYDESAMAEAIAVYVPVMDASTNRAIGVIKAVVDLTSIKREL